MMSMRVAASLSVAAINDARSGRAAHCPAFQAGQAGAGPIAAVFEASCFAGLNSTGCVFADPSLVDV
jgi:hypothetical protein